MQQFDALIRRELAEEIHRLFPDKFVSITQVHVSKDLSFAKVWISAFRETEALIPQLQEKAREIRHTLSKKIVARRVPSFYFVADLTDEKAEKIDRLIDEIKS
ncbi:MAG: ribosome-binding factor A [Candidatus Berkelbacteria bacterium]|nr:ribosome-binding factor A [Candidatus Berkelbacteria bacterium]